MTFAAVWLRFRGSLSELWCKSMIMFTQISEDCFEYLLVDAGSIQESSGTIFELFVGIYAFQVMLLWGGRGLDKFHPHPLLKMPSSAKRQRFKKRHRASVHVSFNAEKGFVTGLAWWLSCVAFLERRSRDIATRKQTWERLRSIVGNLVVWQLHRVGFCQFAHT